MTSPNSKWAKLDAVLWSSAIFSRDAMSVNHLMAHKHGDRKALGIYRIVASCLMFIVFCFLTVYESVITGSRVYMTFAWWVSLGTWLFFTASLINGQSYFNEKVKGVDGPHPFYDWKIVTNLYSFVLQASIHLVILENLQGYETTQRNLVKVLISYVPLTLLVCDWFANRIYFPLT